MIRRLALTAGFAILGAVACTPKANAQSVNQDVPFSATVTSNCAFIGNAQAGTLSLSGPPPEDPGSLGRSLSSENPGGQSGQVTVNCSGGGGLSVSTPQPQTVPSGFSPDDAIATISSSSFDARSDVQDILPVSGGADVDIQVDMEVFHTGNLPAGNYSYNVTVTAAPE